MIKGITVCGNEIKISQYADVTTMILDGSKKSFISALLDLDLFGVISSLRLNNKKIEVLWIGASAGRQDKLCPEKDLKWVTDKLKALRVWISTNPVVSMKANYNEKLGKVRNCLSCWEFRRLSLLGKIVMLKSLIASQLVCILSPLPTNYAALDVINNMFHSFLWSRRGDKIKRDVMISDYKNGGLRMIDIKSFNKALKSTWVRTIWTAIIVVNGNCSLILNYTILVGLLSLRVTSTKMIWQSSYIYQTPLQQKF